MVENYFCHWEEEILAVVRDGEKTYALKVVTCSPRSLIQPVRGWVEKWEGGDSNQ